MKTVTPSIDLPSLDQRILGFWKKSNSFQASLDARKAEKQYLFYDGPPFSSGLPHYGHLLQGTVKDILPRYHTMKGSYVERRFGWDTHGLPIEMIIEKELGLNGRSDIIDHGVHEFNEACRAGVLSCVEIWQNVTERLGRWVDFDNDYKTMDRDFMESVWWVFKTLWENDRIYLGTRVMPYSWRLSTPLSNFEASSNYKEVQDPAITVRFRIKNREDTSLLAWTTTPWTLPANLALCVGPTIEYSEIETKDGERLILATTRLASYFKSEEDYRLIDTHQGKDLENWEYEPLFNYFLRTHPSHSYRVLTDDYVSTADGTGIVHQAPAYGEDDHRVCLAHGIPVFDIVDAEGNFTGDASDFEGRNIKAADKDIIAALKDKGLLYKQEVLNHSYPFCERSDTPLIYKAISAWYVKVEDIREELLQNNAPINWVPEHIRDGRFGKWLENARDWNISRNRFWGNPLPVWICDSCDTKECIGSRTELEQKTQQNIPDLHKHFVDDLSWQCQHCTGTMRRTPEVLDCWFESGSMPYAQMHYPFENKERFEAAFPADFIAEGLDQTRGWFYTLLILGTSLFKTSPFKNVIVTGMILAEDGKKMSKRLKNYPDPLEVLDSYGADALRLYLINSAVVKGESLRFSEAGVKDIVRSVLLPYWNVYSFFTTYANVDGYTPSANFYHSTNDLDRWILSRLQTLLVAIENEMQAYRLYTVVPILLDFLEELTNWYVRRSRRRFWSDDQADKQQGYDTLLCVLLTFSKALAPFLPFITEEIYQNLAAFDPECKSSIHLCDYPSARSEVLDSTLESEMALIQAAVSLGRVLRARLKIRTRQPLQSITVVTKNTSDAATLKKHEQHIIAELNVKEVLFDSNESELVSVSVKPNFPVLGPIFGKKMGAASKELSQLNAEQIAALEDGKTVSILGAELGLAELEVIRRAKAKDIDIETQSGVTVFFDLQISAALEQEGLARELVNRIQKLRKDFDFNVADRIAVEVKAPSKLQQASLVFSDYIQSEVLAEKFDFCDSVHLGNAAKVDIDGEAVEIALAVITP